MRLSNQQFKLQLVLHDKKNSHSKISADHRYRDRLKERAHTPSLATNKLRNTIHIENDRNPGCLNTISYKDKESREFSEKCVNLLSRKKTINESNPCNKTNFNTMLQNIKTVIKENERRDREQKNQQQPMYNNEFHCVRSQIHQIYAYQEKLQLYKMIRNCESRNLRNFSGKTNKSEKNTNSSTAPNKPMVNPFFNSSAVVCFTMALNEPNAQKKSSLFQAPILLRTSTTSACSKRVIQIGRNSTGTKQMNFNLNSDADSQYTKKIKNFFQFIFKVNFSNNLYVSLNLGKIDETLVSNKYRVYIRKGNNSLLIKSLMKRRFWWQIVDSFDDNSFDFYWSQNIIDQIHNKQKISKKKESESKVHKVRDCDDQNDYNRKILSSQKCKIIQNHITKDGFLVPFSQIFVPDTITNHLPRNYCIGSKKNLFKSLFHYYTIVRNKNPFDYIPKTYHIKSTEDQQYRNFIKQNQNEAEKVWIVKPGENSNRGRGIKLSTFKNLNHLIKKNSKHENGQPFTYIVQSYINRPFLYNSRKFDIRHYMLLTSINGSLKAYWYKQGYIRTSSELYEIDDLDNQFIHLTNDAIQRNSEDYQKYQPANKLSYSEFQRYLEYTYPSRSYNLQRDILPKMRQYATDIVKANYKVIDHKRHQNNFQIFGLDFMIDRDFKPWLIEVNYNPCLQVNCPVLQRVIPAMLENSLRLCLDPLFPPTSHFPASKRFYLSDNYLRNLKYQLIFDQDGVSVSMQNKYDFVDQKQKQQEYLDEGKEIVDLLV